MSQSIGNAKKILIWGSRNTDTTVEQENQVVTYLSSATGNDKVTIRPITYQDLGLSADTLGVSLAAGANIIVNNLKLSSGYALAFYGWRDMSATLTISSIQFAVGAVTTPQYPLPLTNAWTDQERTEYFSYIPINKPEVPITVTINSTAANASASFRLIGLIATPGVTTL